MPETPPFPSMRHLRVFETVVRMGSFSAAAEELHTTQSSISRAVNDLEQMLGTKLFERVHRGVHLTDAGDFYLKAVAAGLDRIGTAGAMLGEEKHEPIVIAADHDVSTLFLMPSREGLYQAVGGADTHIHILTCDHSVLEQLGGYEADIVLSYDPGNSRSEDRAVAFRQQVRPVCAPGYVREHSSVLDQPVREWGGLMILDSARTSRGGATWDDWFDAVGWPQDRPRQRTYFNYMFLLEDAVAGMGLMIGCRQLIHNYLESGALIAVGDGFVHIDRPHFVRLTERGRSRPLARRCLEFFDALSRRADGA